eukprot:8370868-Alexandrium_andersonii.AAC.1
MAKLMNELMGPVDAYARHGYPTHGPRVGSSSRCLDVTYVHPKPGRGLVHVLATHMSELTPCAASGGRLRMNSRQGW